MNSQRESMGNAIIDVGFEFGESEEARVQQNFEFYIL